MNNIWLYLEKRRVHLVAYADDGAVRDKFPNTPDTKCYKSMVDIVWIKLKF